ncbi:MAG TPA: hypothetical protein VG963_25005 [Polyangiaceae bacterium]|nr:hypothetical protein [Polyangiaceae bacterium]
MDDAGDVGDQNAAADEMEIGSVGEGLMACANPDGTNAAMAAFAVAVAQDLGRWNATKDFKMITTSGQSETSPGMQQAIALTSGSDSTGKFGKSRCSDGKCARVQAILDMQYDQANNKIYFQGSGSTKVLLSPAALRARMYAKWQDQVACNKTPKDGDANSCTTELNALTFSGSAKGGCDTNFTFAAKSSTGTALKYPNQLKNALKFADTSNPYINFQNLGNGLISVDPTYGLNDDGTTTVGSCTAACTKISTTTSYTGQCCSCGGATKTFSKASFNTSLYLCL